ncbi:MAG: AsmA family protein [Gammaproteobacteria bacterium]|nr:AsmA family protein [Gammaproteobacteria bacterium]MDP2139949.1 AsmA family protein [Gammaproteobacteria bacterium]MDP2347769.1 AsmA family protein [Gammaproteobacteria bacterium]
MKKLISVLLLTLGSVIVFAVAALALLFLVISPDRYKPAIESLFAQQTGLQLNIAGEIDWAFTPVFGLSMRDLRLTNGGSRSELASLSSIAIKIDPWALVDSRIEMQEFIASNLHINWLVDANGVSNWQTADNAATAPLAAPTASAEATEIAASIQQITVSNASLSIQDAQRGINTSFSNLNLTSQNTNLESRPFPFELSFNVADNTAGQAATVSIASNATIDYAAGNARFDNLMLKLNPLQFSGSLVAQDFHNNLSWSGSLASNTFPLSDFLDLYVREAADSALALPGDYSADSDQFSIQVEFNGNSQQINVPMLTLALDDMRLNADAAYTLGSGNAPANLRYNLASDVLDLNRYTSSPLEEPTLSSEEISPEEPAATVASAPAAPSQDTPLPIELLNSMNVQGTHRINTLALAGLTFTNVNVGLTVQNGVLNLDVPPVGFYNGQLTSTINLDTRQNPPSLNALGSIQNVNVAQLAQALPAARFAEGRFNLESLHTARGRTVNELLNSISGTSSFNLADNAIDISIIKQVFSSVSVLSPAGTGDLAQRWPDVVRFNTLEGHLILSGGIAQNQLLNVVMDNFEISANGGIDLPAESFNYDVLLTAFGEPAEQTVPVAPLYQGVGWPVVCNATFASEVSQYCGPDFSKVRDLFVQISRNEVQRRVQDAVTDQVPQDLQDAARGLLDRILR